MWVAGSYEAFLSEQSEFHVDNMEIQVLFLSVMVQVHLLKVTQTKSRKPTIATWNKKAEWKGFNTVTKVYPHITSHNSAPSA